MATECPHCGNQEILDEMRHQNPKSEHTVGTWRVGCGYTMAALLLIFALISFAVSRIWFDPTLSESAVLIAILALVFAVVLLLITIGFARWPVRQQYRCKSCGYRWMTDDTSNVTEATESL